MNRSITFRSVNPVMGVALLLVFVLMADSEALADEPESRIYESLDGIRIGRVFLSPNEREQLDAVRHLKPGPVDAPSTADGATSEPEPEPPRGYGFIKVHGKALRVFKDGDFVSATSVSDDVDAMPPGVFVRHEDAPADADGNGQ